MKTRSLFIPLFVCLFGFVNVLLAQEQELTAEEQKTIDEKYYGVLDYWKADQLFEVGNMKEAQIYYAKASDELEKANNWKPFLRTNWRRVMTYENTPEYKIGAEIGQTAIDKIAKNAPELIKKSDIIYYAIGNAYHNAYDFRSSLKNHMAGLEILNEYYEKNSDYRFGIAYNNIGSTYMQLEEYDKGLDYLSRCIEITNTVEDCPVCTELRGDAYTNTGSIYRMKGNIEKGIEFTEKGIAESIAAHGEFDLGLIQHYYNLVTGYRNIGEEELAIKYMKKVIYIIKESKTQNPFFYNVIIPEITLDIGWTYASMENIDEAFKHFKDGYKVGKNDNQDNLMKISYLTGLGKVNSEKNNFEEAFKYLSEAEVLMKKNNSEDLRRKENVEGTLNLNMAGYYRLQEKYDEAIDYYLKVFKDGFRNNLKNVGTESESLSNVSRLFEMKNEFDSALLYNHYALISSTKTYETFDYLKLPTLEDIIDRIEVYRILRRKGKLINDLALNESDLIQKNKLFSTALSFIDLADDYHMKILKEINLMRSSESNSVISESILPYFAGLHIIYDYFQFSKNEELIEKGFYYNQKMKAQKLWSTLLESEAKKLGSIDNKILEKERDLLADINFYETQLLVAKSKNDTSKISLYENKYLFDLKKEYTNLLREIAVNHKDYYESKYNFIPETIESIQELLTENELLIEFSVEDETIYTYTVEKIKSVQIGKNKLNSNIVDDIIEYNSLLQNPSLVRKSNKEKFITLSHKLYQQFIKPIEKQLEGKKRLVIVGDSWTNYIPFETLLPTSRIKSFNNLDYLIKNHEISYHYSSTLFAKSRRTKKSVNAGLYAFAPVYDNKNLAVKGVSEENILNNTLRAIDNDGSFSPLPETEKEVKSIVKLFSKKKINNTLDLRNAATESSLKLNLEKPYQFIHIAGHSFADVDNPKFSGIACFESAKDAEEDGTLFTGEIYNIISKADLVTLSSCESGFGRLEGTEGMIGLNRAFIYSGSPNVVFSLWKVYDKVSAELMVDFYKNILDNKDYSASLREAKLKLLKKEATASPHFWSPYLLIGR